MNPRPKLRITNARPGWVKSELENLIAEWEAWTTTVADIQDHPLQPGYEHEIYRDGKENILKHSMLQEKTRVFLDNNVEGHNFIVGFDGNHIDRTDLRLKVRVEHRLEDIHILNAALPYAIVPEGYWKDKAKEVLDRISNKGVDAAIDVVASYLENPIKS